MTATRPLPALRATLIALLLAPAAGLAMPAAASRARAPQGDAAVARITVGSTTIEAPLFSEKYARTPIAKVGDEEIVLEDLVDALAAAHEERAVAATHRQDFGAVVDRLVTVKLLVREAREMGLDDLDDVKRPLREFKEGTLREMVKRAATRNVRFDPKEAERLYREQIREQKVQSVLFTREEDAKRMRAAIEAGGKFDELADRAVAEKRARSGGEGRFLSPDKLAPQVAAAVAGLEKGAVTLPVKLPDGWAVVEVEDVRYRDDASARAWAENASRERKTVEALHAYHEKLLKRYGKVDRAVLKALDYEKGKLEALRKDRRVLATIEGEKPVTVAALTAEMERKFHHGVERAAGEKRVNAQKQAVFDSLLFRRLLDREARRQKLADTEAYRRAVAEREQSLLFGLFVQRVIFPQVQVEEDEAKRHYEAHKSEYMYPQFYKLDGLAFASADAAQAALAKLRSGTDLGWLRANAEGQLPEADRKLQLTGTTVAATALPPDLAKALAGAKAGDDRLYPTGDGAYVIHVVADTPPAPQPYKDVREEISRKVFAQKLNEKVQQFAARLRAASSVQVFITGLGS